MIALQGRGSSLLSLVFTVCFFTVSFASGFSFDQETSVTESGLLPEPVPENVSVQSNLSTEYQTFEGTSGASFTYDANGNLINGKGLSYIYDDANHLSEVRYASNNSLIATYYYDAAGNRVKKVSGGVTTYYIGDYLETQVKGAQRNDTSYYFANAERVARKDPDGKKYYYHGDHLGSTSIVTNASGAVVESVAYLPYGETQSRTGSGSTYLYTDQELDPESALYYYGARYYSPELMRFVEPDPVIQNIFNPQYLNRYTYALNNPVNAIDPSGSSSMILEGQWNSVTGGVALLAGMASGNPFAISSGGVKFLGGLTMQGMGIYTGIEDIYDLSLMAVNTPGANYENHMAQCDAETESVSEWINTASNPLAILGISSTEYDLAMVLTGGPPGDIKKLKGALDFADMVLTTLDYGRQLPLEEILVSTGNPHSSFNSDAIGGSTTISSTSNSVYRPSSGSIWPGAITKTSSQTCSAYNGYSPTQALVETSNSPVGGSSTEPQYGYNPHKYPWDSSPLKGWD